MLALLYDVAGRAPTFRLESLQALLTETEIAHWATLKEQVAIVLGLPRHRACADARLLQATFGKLRAQGVPAPASPATPAAPSST